MGRAGPGRAGVPDQDPGSFRGCQPSSCNQTGAGARARGGGGGASEAVGIRDKNTGSKGEGLSLATHSFRLTATTASSPDA